MPRSSLLLACALALGAGLPGHAQTQNHVTLYGLVDAGVEHLNHVNGGGGITRMPTIAGSAASRWGLRGSEDLGGGLKAVFTLESGFGSDTGTLLQGGRAFGRQAFVGLSGNWGSVTLGRQYSMLLLGAVNTDILLAQIYGAGVFDTYLAGPRLDNALAYQGKFGGFSLGVLYSLGKDSLNCAGERGNGRECRAWSAALKYETPAWGVGAWLDEQYGRDGSQASPPAADLSGKKEQRLAVSGYVMAGQAKLVANYMQRTDKAAVDAYRKGALWSVGVAYPLTQALTLEAQYYDFSYRNSDDGGRMLALRGTYAFSRRTAAYLTVGALSNEGRARFSPSVTLSGTALAPAAGQSQTGIMVGLRHAF